MDKIIFADIKYLEVSHVQKAMQAMKRQKWLPPYRVRVGFGVKLGPGTKEYLRDNEVIFD